MPEVTVLVTGTGTEVGKTWVAARLLRVLRASDVAVAARKPVQSFDPDDYRRDAEILAGASDEDEATVCPPNRSYERALAPPMAADVLGRPMIPIKELLDELRLPDGGVAIIEGVGGPRSPLAHDGDTTTLARLLQPDLVLLVAPAGLGAINAVLTCAGAFDRSPIVFLNRFDPDDALHVANMTWLREREAVDVVTRVEEIAARLGIGAQHSELV